MTTATDNETIARRIFEEVWQNHNYDVIDELLADVDLELVDSRTFSNGVVLLGDRTTERRTNR